MRAAEEEGGETWEDSEDKWLTRRGCRVVGFADDLPRPDVREGPVLCVCSYSGRREEVYNYKRDRECVVMLN